MAWCRSSSTPSLLPWPSTRVSHSLPEPGDEGADLPLVGGIARPAFGDIAFYQRHTGHFQQQRRDQQRRQQQPPHMAGGIADDEKAPPHRRLAEIVGMTR